MNTNALKKFAQEARIKLITQIASKLEYVLTSDSSELREKAAQVRQIRKEERTTRIEARRAEREAAKQAEQNGASAPPWTGVNNCTEPPNENPNTNQTINPAPQQQTLFAMA